MHAERCDKASLAGDEAIVRAAAVGLVIEVWRNSPVEDMHASSRGPSDAAMFAESTALHDHAIKALTATNRNHGLLEFEEHLLNRTRPWAGTSGRTLQDLGYGFLGRYEQHVKDRINALMALGDHSCVEDPLSIYLINRALGYGSDHKGMPGWQTIVERIGVLLRTPNHPAWRKPSYASQALADMPPQIHSIDELTAALLAHPFELPEEVLNWLSRHLLYCAAPPYSLYDWHTSEGTASPAP